jgi:hypothetical protein
MAQRVGFNISYHKKLLELLGIGVDNKQWVNCIFTYCTTFTNINCGLSIRNTGANNLQLYYDVPLIYLRGAHMCYIDALKFALIDADVNDYISRTRIYGWNNNTIDTLYDDLTDYGTIETRTIEFDAINLSSYERVFVRISVETQDALDFELNFINLRYYYNE